MYHLYIKTHRKTGLKYLGQTKSKNPQSYRGSGTRWINHIKKHGYDCETEIILSTEDKEELKRQGIYYSELYNVVASKAWANLKTEAGDGGTGAPAWNKGKTGIYSEELRLQMGRNSSAARKGVKRGPYENFRYDDRVIAVTVDGVDYKSIEDAKRSTGHSYNTINKKNKNPDGYDNNRKKKIIVEGGFYGSIEEVTDKFRVCRQTVRNRLRSDQFPDWNYA